MAEMAVWGAYSKITFNMENINFLDSVKGSQFKTVEVQEVLQQIQKGYWRDQINDIRYHMKNENSIEASED